MALADIATPTATLPLPDTPSESASMLEVSSAEREMSPPASTSDLTAPSLVTSLVIWAFVLLATTLPARVTWTEAPEPVAATPPAKLNIVDSVSASIFRVDPLETVDPEICARTELAMTLAPIIAEMAALPEAAMLRPNEVICESSLAAMSVSPPERTMEPPSIEASVEFAITLPKPVAWIATLPGRADAHRDRHDGGFRGRRDDDVARCRVDVVIGGVKPVGRVIRAGMRHARQDFRIENTRRHRVGHDIAHEGSADRHFPRAGHADHQRQDVPVRIERGPAEGVIHFLLLVGSEHPRRQDLRVDVGSGEGHIIAGNDSRIVADQGRHVLVTTLPSAETETATLLPPETPMPSALMIEDETEVRLTSAVLLATIVPASLTPARTVESFI